MDNQEEIIITPTPAPIREPQNTLAIFTPCKKTVKTLKRLISGRCGLLTLAHTYLFQSIITKTQNPNLSATLFSLAQNSLTDTSTISSLILSFGGLPTFTNGQGAPFSTKNVCYNTNQTQFITCNIQKERCILLQLERAIQQHPNLAQPLAPIIQTRQNNIQTLQKLL